MSDTESEVEYTLPEVAVLAGVQTSEVRLWVRAGRLPSRTGPNGEARVRRSELARFFEEHGMPPPKELGAALRELEQMLARAHPAVRAKMITDSEWPLARYGRAEAGAASDRPRE